jgi:hypothetical protein
MSKAAFSARKARHSFPDEAVLRLQQSSRPNLNVFFVLFGAGGPERDGTSAETDPNYIREWVVRYEHALSHSVEELYSDAIRHPRVQKLLNHLLHCSDSTLELLIKLADRLREADAKEGTVATPFTLRPSFHREIANAAPALSAPVPEQPAPTGYAAQAEQAAEVASRRFPATAAAASAAAAVGNSPRPARKNRKQPPR